MGIGHTVYGTGYTGQEVGKRGHVVFTTSESGARNKTKPSGLTLLSSMR